MAFAHTLFWALGPSLVETLTVRTVCQHRLDTPSVPLKGSSYIQNQHNVHPLFADCFICREEDVACCSVSAGQQTGLGHSGLPKGGKRGTRAHEVLCSLQGISGIIYNSFCLTVCMISVSQSICILPSCMKLAV